MSTSCYACLSVPVIIFVASFLAISSGVGLAIITNTSCEDFVVTSGSCGPGYTLEATGYVAVCRCGASK